MADAKRAKTFTKLTRAVAIAARGGADPAANFSLRIAIDKARAVNVPKENIERAIARGAGTGDEAQLEEALYEIVAPNGIGILVEALTDSKNRTSNEIKNLAAGHGATLGAPNSVLWMFERKGIIVAPNTALTDDIELVVIDAGAEDITRESDEAIITLPPDKLHAVKTALEHRSITPHDVSLEWIAKELTTLDAETEAKIRTLLDALDDMDDVQNISTTAEL